MSAKLVQCPGCGAAIDAPVTGAYTTCGYCGARLEITTGASGAPLARLSEIKADTGFMAKDRARAHLRDKLDKLDAQIETLVQAADTSLQHEYDTTHRLRLGLGILFVIVVWPMFSSSGFLYGCMAGAVVAGAVTLIRRYTTEKTVKEYYLDRIRPLRESRRQLADELQRLEEQLDVLARELTAG